MYSTKETSNGHSNHCKKLSLNDGKDVIQYIKNKGVELVDCCFTDPLGVWHHCTFYSDQIDESTFTEGLAFDGSSIKLFREINESDMIMIPDPKTAFIDPFHKHKVLHLTCSIHIPGDIEGYDRCPRSLAKRAMEYLKSTGIADTVMTGPEAEFFMFDNVDYKVEKNECRFFLDGEEGYWNSGSKNNLGHRAEYK